MKARHRFHSICPYFAMFPETFVRRNLLAWSARGDLVLDPFSGRGTTVFESLLNGRRAIGCDINPVAFCVSRAKVDPPSLNAVQRRILELEKTYATYAPVGLELRNQFFRLCFHRETLKQLLFLRTTLDWRKNRADCFIAAMALGCLHGESHRTELCFSNRMPRTISTKPAYSVRWWRAKQCTPPQRDVFKILRRCADYRYQSPVPSIKGRVVQGDVRRAAMLLRHYRGKVKLVITSPPYLDITDYHEDQWLRLWFLGGPTKPIAGQSKDDRHHRVEAYWQFLREAWKGISPLLHESAQVVIRIGGTRLSEEELRKGLLESLNSSGRKFKLAESQHSLIRNSQRRSFLAAPKNAPVEYDYRFKLV